MSDPVRRVEVPEGPARRALVSLREALDHALQDLEQQAGHLKADTARQALLVLAGMGHDISGAAGLTIEQDGSSVALVRGHHQGFTGPSIDMGRGGEGPPSAP